MIKRRLWIDGSYRLGFIGYGVYGRPGDIKLYGGQPGVDSHSAELLAAEKALETVRDGEACTLYTDSHPVIAFYAETPISRIRLTVAHIKRVDAFHNIAHELANLGREQAYRKRSVE